MKVHQSVLAQLKQALSGAIQPGRMFSLVLLGILETGVIAIGLTCGDPELQQALLLPAAIIGFMWGTQFLCPEWVAKMDKKSEKAQLIDTLERRIDLWSQLVPDTIPVP